MKKKKQCLPSHKLYKHTATIFMHIRKFKDIHYRKIQDSRIQENLKFKIKCSTIKIISTSTNRFKDSSRILRNKVIKKKKGKKSSK